MPTWLPVLLVAGVTAPGQPGEARQETSPCALFASTWKHEVLLQEPILVSLTLTNPTPERVLVVPPYLSLSPSPREAWPLTFAVFDDQGQAVPNHWELARTGFELMAFGRPWWLPETGPSPVPSVPPRRPWDLPARGSGFMWINLTQFYPLDEPGRY
jgi:hypothetical protein